MKNEAANDPRFDTSWKRLNWFRRPNETDEQFAERLGISLSDLNDWRVTGEAPDETIDYYKPLCRKLDVDAFWLIDGEGHEAKMLRDDKTRLTSIPRFQPWHQFTDSPEAVAAA